jgi:hypothetical protein
MRHGIRERIDTLLSTEMDRASFIKVFGVAVLAAAGITGFIRALTTATATPQGAASPQANTYGGRTFGE